MPFPRSPPKDNASLLKALLLTIIRAFLLATTLAGSPAFAQKTKPTSAKAPPPPIPRKYTLDRGQQINVPLAVYGSGVENMQFLIRTAPKVGTLSQIMTTGDNTATVTYTLPDDTTALEDRFFYAVKTPDGVSAPVAVTITIAEAVGLSPRLVVPGSLEMEAVRPGESTSIIIAIKNAGGGIAQGNVAVPAPWSIAGPTRFRLAGGAKTEFKVSFSSATTGTQKADITYGPGQRVSTTLTATVLSPFKLTPALLELAAKPGATTRTGQIRITNEGPEPQLIAIKHNGKLLTETSITIPGRQTQSLAVFAEPTEVGPLEDRLMLKCGDWSAEIPVIAKALGPIITCSAKSIEFPDAATDHTAVSTILLENTGGTLAALTLATTAPFRTEPTAIALKPKSSSTITILCKAESPGTAQATLSISGTSTQIDIPLTAQIKTAKPIPRPALSPAPVLKSLPPIPQTPAKTSLAEPRTGAEIPGIVGKIGQLTHSTAAIEWTSAPKPNLHAQARILSATPSGPILNWKDLEATFTQEGALMRCSLKSLTPQTLYTVRILAGDTTECTVNIVTPLKPPFPITLQNIIITLLLGTAGWLLWKRWKTTARSGW